MATITSLIKSLSCHMFVPLSLRLQAICADQEERNYVVYMKILTLTCWERNLELTLLPFLCFCIKNLKAKRTIEP